MLEMIILVDKNDKEIGYMEKIEAHKNGGTLHRAFSIFIFNSRGEMLLQKRSVKKHHFGGLWTNACCSHPLKGENLDHAIHRKLHQEMGFDCSMKEIFSFIYQADWNNGLSEHEFDHVYVGIYDGILSTNREEVDEYRYVDISWLKDDVKKHPENYTPWFKIALTKVLEHVPHIN
ncbi:MAG: isopentenyl-diphosphate Delta-isomerase [Candidatus Aenigmarchaeota archaeon]|nr:isopentenyl-diphosphate Delta-isomerase [Candidatus Aenigmarchaeota archaeon]